MLEDKFGHPDHLIFPVLGITRSGKSFDSEQHSKSLPCGRNISYQLLAN